MENIENNIEEKVGMEETEEEREERLLVSDYLLLCLAFEKDPTEENQANINNFLSKLIIREYLPLKEKTMAMMDICAALDFGWDAPGAAWNLEILKVEKALFRYCINLDNDMGIAGHTFGAYDDYIEYGLIDTIETRCKVDYQRFREMLSDTINTSNIYRLIDTVGLLNDTEFDKWTQTMKDLKESLDPDMIKALVSLNIRSGEEMKKITDMLSADALKDANEQIKADMLREESYKTGKFSSEGK